MKTLKVLTLDQASEWDFSVRSFFSHDIYWLSGYVKAFKIHGDGEPLLFYYDNGNTRGINVVMKRDIADDTLFKDKLEHGQYFDITTPYGYGGWLIEGKGTTELFNEYENWLKRNNIISEFVRFHPMIKNHEECSSFYDIFQLGEVVHIDLSSPEVIWENFSSKNRNMVRKAIKNDVKIYNGRFLEIFEEFRKIYNLTMDKDNADEYYYFSQEFYSSILNDLNHNAEIFYAVKGDKVIAASIILMCNGYLNYHLSGSLHDYYNLASTNLLLYEVALWGSEHGFKSLYLGGGVGSEEDNLFAFKRSFYKGNLNRFYIGKKIINGEVYKKLVGLKNEGIHNPLFFPQYRG